MRIALVHVAFFVAGGAERLFLGNVQSFEGFRP
jgi:hypothetical protein